MARKKWCITHGYFMAVSCPDCERERTRRPRRRARGTYEWKQARAAAQRRDGFRCVRCGLTNRKTKLEVHHKDGNPLSNDLANLETLCVRHHREVGGGTPSPRQRAVSTRRQVFAKKTWRTLGRVLRWPRTPE